MIKTKVVQNVNRMSEIFFSLCQYVNKSLCHYVRMQLFSLGIKMKVVQDVKRTSENNISVCQYVNMSECNFSAYRIPPFQLSCRYKVSCSSMSLSPAINNRCRYLEEIWKHLEILLVSSFTTLSIDQLSLGLVSLPTTCRLKRGNTVSSNRCTE